MCIYAESCVHKHVQIVLAKYRSLDTQNLSPTDPKSALRGLKGEFHRATALLRSTRDPITAAYHHNTNTNKRLSNFMIIVRF